MSAADTPAVDWAALRPGDPDPEPFAEGECCDVYVAQPDGGAQFDCTRSPHDDPHHVTCGWWKPFTQADSIVIATWTDQPDGAVTSVRLIARDDPRVLAAGGAR